jgi:integrase
MIRRIEQQSLLDILDRILDIMSAVFRHGIRHGFLPREKEANPMTYVGLMWQDIDFQKQRIHIRRSVIYGVTGQCKSKASRRPVPLDPLLADLLLQWRSNSAFDQPEDCVFCQPKNRRETALLAGDADSLAPPSTG